MTDRTIHCLEAAYGGLAKGTAGTAQPRHKTRYKYHQVIYKNAIQYNTNTDATICHNWQIMKTMNNTYTRTYK